MCRLPSRSQSLAGGLSSEIELLAVGGNLSGNLVQPLTQTSCSPDGQ